ncbi:MAG: hypothetical protein PVF10_15490, partial [Syntrophobacterales bacterium]
MRLQHLDVVAPASLEPPNLVGGAALYLRNTLLRIQISCGSLLISIFIPTTQWPPAKPWNRRA